ncbi:hypothetical protein BD410DRAFT_795696 [Rickenella mellea]|uniref:MARVEL domain-containing protein n=1 Tax=Rickenella mellea TaxID=50990 RepID=A0A4Y7PKR7_9AGAM|nr:hypothetical protein BD410DRAFT_795696 [Rickenella mellea]
MDIARLTSLGLAWVFSLISGSLGLNALFESSHSKSFLKKNAPSGVTLTIDASDILQSGVVLTVSCALLAILTSVLLLLAFFPRKVTGNVSTTRGYRIQAYVTAFTTLWIFAALIAYDVVVSTRSARVTAMVGKLTLPDSAVRQQEMMLGVSPVYWKQNYLRWQAFVTWFAVLFGTLSSIFLFLASRSLLVTKGLDFDMGNTGNRDKEIDTHPEDLKHAYSLPSVRTTVFDVTLP